MDQGGELDKYIIDHRKQRQRDFDKIFGNLSFANIIIVVIINTKRLFTKSEKGKNDSDGRYHMGLISANVYGGINAAELEMKSDQFKMKWGNYCKSFRYGVNNIWRNCGTALDSVI